MVYCGKPSKACHACRSRKTRCDAKADGCTQCFKARRICPGYRSQVDVIFRDQSANVIKKSKASEAKKTATQFSPSQKWSASALQREAEPEIEGDVRFGSPVDGGLTIRPTLEESATGYFVFNYIVGINAPTRMRVDNLEFMYKNSTFDETLTTAVRAVSFASFAHHTSSGQLADASTYHYAKAISLTNVALRCPSEAVKDTTLMSILILGMYEVITGIHQRSIRAWMEHVHGSAALLKLRGMEQLDTIIGRRLFVQALTGILTTSIQLCIPIPKSIIKMTKKVRQLIPDSEDFGKRAYDIQLCIIDANHFRHAVATKQVTDPAETVSKALELDARFVAVWEESGPEWKYSVLHADYMNDSIIYRGVYHVYPDLLTGTLWNAVRVMRGLLHECCREILLKGFAARPPIFTQPEHTAQFQATTEIMYQLQAEILASVPQHLGFVKMAVRDDPASGLDTLNDPLHFARVRSNGGLNLMWPLFYAGTREISTPEVHAYCVKNLRRIGDDMGIKQALVLARILESNNEVDAWAEKPRVELEDD